jgi:hypothetical protein
MITSNLKVMAIANINYFIDGKRHDVKERGDTQALIAACLNLFRLYLRWYSLP